MKLTEWHAIRDRILQDESPVRLDCLNPFAALASWRMTESGAVATPDRLISGFREAFMIDASIKVALTKGIRSFLRSVMKSTWGQNALWIIPADVFPTYSEIAKEMGVRRSEMITWPTMQFKISAQTNFPTVLLLPVPHSPTGKDLTETELKAVRTWLEQSSNHFLLLDLVYTYEPLQPSVLGQLLRTSPNVLAAYSMSKTWLQRCLAGCAAIPNKIFDDIFVHCEPPSPNESGLAVECLKNQVSLPKFQATCFKSKWHEFLPTLQKASPHWLPPHSGYLSTIHLDWDTMLEKHGILGVPPALFGSSASDYSIISCLHDLSVTYEP